MPRSLEQRLGDITLVLVAFAALTFVGTAWAAASHTEGHIATFWSYLGLSAPGYLIPGFAAACAFNWMDDARRRPALWAVLSLLAVAAVAALGEAVFGGGSDFNGDRGASYFQDAASLLMVAGGVTLVLGLLPVRSGEPESND